MNNSFNLTISHNVYLREKLIFNGTSELYKIYPFFSKRITKKVSVPLICLFALKFTICSLSGLLQITKNYIICLTLPCQLASGHFWPRGGTSRLPERGDEEKPGFLSFSCLLWLPSLAKSYSFPINSQPPPTPFCAPRSLGSPSLWSNSS